MSDRIEALRREVPFGNTEPSDAWEHGWNDCLNAVLALGSLADDPAAVERAARELATIRGYARWNKLSRIEQAAYLTDAGFVLRAAGSGATQTRLHRRPDG
ncbi:hypothetical protein LCGC14_2931890 [marine sediment metagenome]|uniref:Uncharacterized protein n=1 Tax=marine sediment metagenome TaxID=412755 RepID=A0A0F9ABN9_9ZZZZ